MKKSKGFTLIELMIVVAIIAIIAAIAIPNLLRSRIQSNESAAIGNLRTVVGAETAFNSAKGTYTATWGDMTGTTPPFLDGAWDGTKNGYKFVLGGGGQQFTCNGDPETANVSGIRGFFTDTSGVIRAAAVAPASAASTPIGQ